MVKMKKVLNALCGAVIVLSFVLLIFFNWSILGWQILDVPTSSMKPAIPQGSLVLVHGVPISSLKIGDVITYVNPLSQKTTLSHRIIKKYVIGNNIAAFVTKGDANSVADIPITEGSVQGKVLWHVPRLGNLLMVLKNPLLILPIVYIAGILVMADEVKRLSDYYKLNQPYRMYGFIRIKKQASASGRRFTYGISATVMATLMLGVGITPQALALLSSKIVSLTNNNLSVAHVTKCTQSTNSNTSITVNNASTQTGTSGNSSTTSNTTGGSSTSGNVNNSNSSSTTITITNC
jgi:signal peptidase I